MTETDSNIVYEICSICGDLLSNQFYMVNAKPCCRKCYTTYILQTKQYQIISEYCTCDGAIKVSVCPNCGKVRYERG
jgi:hypothetical protein